MSLFRFSVYPKLLTCIGAAYLISGHEPIAKRLATLLVTLAILIVIAALGEGFALGGVTGDFVRANEWMLLLFASLCAVTAAYQWLTAPRASLRPALAALLIPLCLAAAWRHLGL